MPEHCALKPSPTFFARCSLLRESFIQFRNPRRAHVSHHCSPPPCHATSQGCADWHMGGARTRLTPSLLEESVCEISCSESTV